MTLLFVLGGALLLSLVHLEAGKLRFLHVVPRSRWLSFGSGISVAYVFLHLLPELSRAQGPLRRAMDDHLSYLDHHGFALAAVGLATFYGLERLAELSRARSRRDKGEDVTTPGVFWLHIGSFAGYNVLIGYLLIEKVPDTGRYLLFVLAIALHFLVNDYGLRQHHKESYHRIGRWVLAAAVVAGALIGCVTQVASMTRLVPFSFLAGGIIMNVLKEELPAERESRFWAFALGLVLYGSILIAL